MDRSWRQWMCILFYQHVRCRLGLCTMVLRECCCVGSGSERLGFSHLWSGALAWEGGMTRMRSVQIAETVPFTFGQARWNENNRGNAGQTHGKQWSGRRLIKLQIRIARKLNASNLVACTAILAYSRFLRCTLFGCRRGHGRESCVVQQRCCKGCLPSAGLKPTITVLWV